MASKDTFEGLDVTADEVQRIEKALKNEEFRKLFVEYAQEISDPENRKKYEEELAELERSRGMDVKFLHPEPGYVLKTSINGEKKAFINICKNDVIGKPEATKSYQGNGNARKMGVQWSLPYSLAAGRDDYDHAGKKCVVYDCMFHPECFEMINKDSRFRTLMDNTAIEGIEREFKVTLDQNNVKRPKMKFKGRPQATIIRTPNQTGAKGENSLDALNLSYPYDQSTKQVTASQPAKSCSKISGNGDSEKHVKKDGFTEPKYSIVHRGHFDMQQFTYARDSAPSTRPQELILKVELPLLKSAAPVQLDVFEKRIFLECKKPVMYQLDLPLPYPVDEDKGSAKFDKSRSCLIVTLAVQPPVITEIPSTKPVSHEANRLVQEIVMNDINENNNQITKQNDGIMPACSDGYCEKSEASENLKGNSDEVKLGNSEVGASDNEITLSIKRAKTSYVSGDDQGCPEEDAAGYVEESELSNPCTDEVHTDELLHNEAKMKPNLPKYDIYQTEQNVTFIIREANIEAGSFKVDVVNGGKVVKAMFNRTKLALDSAEETFNLFINCEEGQSLGEKVNTDVSMANVVMMFKKKEGSGCLWSTVKAGVSANTLEERRFVTEEGLEDVLKVATSDESRSQDTIPCSVSEFSADCVRAQFQVSCEVADSEKSSQDSAKGKGDSSGSKNKKASMRSKESIIPALDLGPAADEKKEESDASSPRSDSQSSPTGSSLPSGLKSALRSPRRRACKSVSFSEEVLVELFLDGPKRTPKGGNKKKGGRRTPFFGPRRMIEKLKDNSWEYFSDSELLHHKEASTEEDEEHDAPEWNWQPNQVLMRQSSSESESGQEIPSSPRSKGKKSKGSRRRRKEKARREASLAASNGVENSDTNENHSKPSSLNDVPPLTNGVESGAKTECFELSDDTQELPENSDLKNNNERKKSNENDELPLEMQDHKTKCAFEFSNQVIFDLDE